MYFIEIMSSNSFLYQIKCVSLRTKYNVHERKAFLYLPMQQGHRSRSIYHSLAVVTVFTTTLNSQKPKIVKTEFIYVFYVNLRTNGDHLLCEIKTLRTGLLNCLNARSRGLTFRHRASCI